MKKIIYVFCLGVLSTFFYNNVYGQTLVNNAALVINPGAQVHIRGSLLNNSTATLVVDGTLEIRDNFINHQEDLTIDGDVVFFYSQEHKILGSEAVEFENLTIGEDSWLIVGDAGSDADRLTVNGTLTNNAGPAGLILRSHASLMHNNAGVEATFGHFINSSANSWHLLSSPFSAQPFMPDLLEDGVAYAWHEPAQTWVGFEQNSGWPTWDDANSGHSQAIPGKGYLVAFDQTDVFRSLSGTLNQGLIEFPVTIGSNPNENFHGYNLAGNPYPSAVDWKSPAGWTRTSLEEAGPGAYAYWIWNDVAGNYGTFISDGGDGSGTNGVSRHIAPKQGFWVKAAANGQLQMDNQVRVHASQEWLKSGEDSDDLLKLKLFAEGMPYFDELVFEFGKADGGAHKLWSHHAIAPGFAAWHDHAEYSIARYANIPETPVPLSFKASIAGNHSIQLLKINGVSQALLEDTQTGVFTELVGNTSYSFFAEPGDIAQRFRIHFNPVGIGEMSSNSFTAFFSGNQLFVQNPLDERAVLTISAVDGTLLGQYVFLPKQELRLPVNYSQGVYLLRISGAKASFHKKLVFIP